MTTRNYWGKIAAILLVSTLWTCSNPFGGLGSKVDIFPPELSISTPSAGSNLNRTFTVTGTAKDDIQMKAVSIRLKDMDSGVTVLTLETSLVGSEWSVVLDSLATNLPDGRYTLIAVAEDATGKISETQTLVIVDNTPPTVMVTSPSLYGTGIPAFNKYITLKGEVYDPNLIRSVKVDLLDSTTLASVVNGPITAEGTNTWLYRMDTNALLDGTYLLSVTAEDAAGNISADFYHTQDIRSLLPANSIIPTINVIGGIDQRGDLSAEYPTLTEEDVVAKRNPALPSASSRQVAFPVDQDTDKPRFSISLPEDGGSVGANSRVLGNISDDKDSFDLNSIRVQVWTGASTVTPAAAPVLDFKLAVADLGTLTDTSLPFSFDFTGSKALTVSGWYTMRMDAKDGAGLDAIPSLTTFFLNKSGPSINNIIPSNNSYIGTSGVVEVQISALDDNGISLAELYMPHDATTPVASQVFTSPQPSVTHIFQLPENYLADYEASTGKTEVTARVVVQDNDVENPLRAELTMIYAFDKDMPMVTASSPQSGETVNGLMKIRASADDGTGQIRSNTYQITDDTKTLDDMKAAAPASWASYGTGQSLYNPQTSVDTRTLATGNHILWLKAVDLAGNTTISSVPFTVDQNSDKPEISLISLNSTVQTEAAAVAGNNTLTQNLNISGRVSDDDAVDPTKVELSVERKVGASWSSVTSPAPAVTGAGTDLNFSFNVNSFQEGLYRMSLTAWDGDINGAKGGLAAVSNTLPGSGWVYFVINKSAPVLYITPLGNAYTSASKAISGTIYDGNQVQKVEYSTDGGTTYNAAGLIFTPGLYTAGSPGAWSLTIDLSTVSATDGPITVKFRGVDEFNLASLAQDVNLVLDRTAPVITMPALGGYWKSGSALDWTGSAAEVTGAATVRTWTGAKNAAPPADRSSWIPATTTFSTGTTNWSTSLNLATLGEGDKTIHVEAVDLAGNASTVATLDFGVDQNPPVLEETTAGAVGQATATVGRNALFSLGGTWADTQGITSLKVFRDVSGTLTEVYSEASLVGTSGPWTTPTTLPGVLTDGTYTYKIVLTDKAGKTSERTRTITIDQSGPTVTIQNPVANQLISTDTLVVQGLTDDGAGSGTSLVKYWLGAQGDVPPGVGTWSNTAVGLNPWSVALNLGATGLNKPEGYYTIHIAAVDNASNWSSVEAVTFLFDKSVPTLTTGSPASQFTKDDITLTGTASDTNGMDAADPIVYTRSKNGGAPANFVPTWTAPNWSIDVPTSLGDGTYEFVITAKDKAGRISTVTRTVVIDIAAPDLTVSLPVNGELVDTNNYMLRGQVTDNGGRGVTQLQYSRDNISWTNITISGLNWTVGGVDFSSPVGAETPQGARTLYVRASDGINGFATETITFNYDTAPPTLTETTSTLTDALVNRNAPVSFGGAASDTNALSTVTVKVNTDAPVAVTGTTTWSYTMPNVEGSYTLVFTATDAAGRTTSITRNVVLDKTNPSLPVFTSTPGAYVTNSLSVAGTATDTLSGVQNLYFRLNGADGDAATGTLTGTADWFSTINVGALPEGSHTVYVWSLDRAGNKSAEASQAFKVDRNDPTLTSAEPSSQNTKVDMTLDGVVSDVNGLSTWDDDANGGTPEVPYVDVVVNGGAATKLTVSGGAWSINVDADAGDGTFVYVITATDGVGRSSSLTRTVVVDKTAPTVAVTSHSDGNVVALVNLVMSGTAADALSGVAGVEYRMDGNNDGDFVDVGIDSDWTALSGTTNWNGTIALGAEGLKKLEFRSRDALTTYSSTQILTLALDLSAPTLTETGVGTASPRRSDDFTLSGTAGDTNGLLTWDDDSNGGTPEVPYVEVSVNGAAATKHTVTAGAWTYNHTIGADGDVNFVITATDVVGKTSSLTRTVKVDSTAPVISVDGVIAGLNVSSNEVNGVITFRFSADDAGVGLESPSAGNYRAYYTLVADGAGIPATPVDMSGWTAVNSASSVFSFTYDTSALGTAGAVNRDLWVVVRDNVTGGSNVPNLASVKTDLAIDQESDRPLIAFDNMNDAAALNSENGFGQNPTVLLTIEDDDRVDVSLLQYRIDANNDGDFADTAVELGTPGDKWENETVWNDVEEVPTSDRSLAQAKIKLNSFPQGAYRIQVRARDNVNTDPWTTIYGNNGNFTWKESPAVRFSVDFGPPSIAVTAPLAGVYKDNFAITGSASDALGVIKIEYTLDGGSTYETLYDVPGGTLTSVPFSDTVDISLTPSGEYVLQVEATDFGGSTATQQIPITIDRTAPTVTVLQPGASAVLNGASVTVRGEASDNRQLGAVFLWHGLVSDPDPAVLPSRTGPGTYSAGSYTQVTGASIWNLNIDTTATVSTAANGYRIRLVAVDSIGNVGTPTDHLVTINQESDRPVVAFSNLTIPGPSRLALGNLSIIGTISDDDSVDKDSLQIRIDRNGDLDFDDANEGWVPVSDPPASNALIVSWVHLISDINTEGLHHVQVRALDVNDSAGNYSTGYNWNISPVVPFMIDNGPPALTVTTPTLGQRFNVNQFSVTGNTQDTNGIKRVVIWVDNDEDTIQDAGELTILGKAMDNSGTALTTDNTLYNISQLITGLSDGVKTVRVTSYDSSDAITVRELTVVIDTTAPSAAISTPAASSTVNGTIAVIGTATDNYQVSQVYYNVRLTASGAPAYPADYTLLAGQTYAWNFNLNTTGFADGAYTLRVVVVDSATNNSSASPATVAFTIDQTTDRPVIDVLTLDELSPAVQNLLPPSLAVSGTVQDDDSVDRTKIQVRSRTLPAGVWSAWGAISNPPATNTALAIWSHTFTGFTDGQYEFEIRAADTNDAGGWTGGAFSWASIAAVPFAVDLSLPTGGITTPAAGSYHRSDVSISGTSADASGIKRITIAYDTGSGYGAENVLLNDTDPGDGYALAPNWNTSYPVSSGEGQVFFRVTITDAFDKIRTVESNFTVDTVAPTVSFQLPSSGATLNGSVLARGTTSDAGPVSQVWFKVNNAAGAGTWAAPADLSANGWTLLSGNFNWEQRFKSTGLSNGGAMIYVVAVDAAGNRSNPTQPANQLSFTVNQSQNLPVVTLTTADNALLDNGGVITGTVTDDDGVNASSLEISFDGGTTWRAVSNPGTSGAFVSFSHALSAGAGLTQRELPYSVVVRANDIGENFDGGDFTGPQDIAPVQGTSASITIRKDDSDPVAGITSLNNGVATVLTLSGAYISDEFTLLGTSTDGVRVANVEARLPGLAGHDTFASVTDTGTDFSTWSYAKTGLTLVGTTQNLEVRVTDVNGRTTTQAYTLLVDTTPPTVGFDSTALNPDTVSGAYNGTVTFRGNATDNVLVSTVYYRFAAADPGVPDASFTGWTQAASAYSWTAVLDTTTVHNLGSDFAYRLYAVSVDAAGNVAARQNLAFNINQASDRPVLNLTSPTNGQVLQTNAKALGSLSDDDALASVAIRIDRNNDGDFGDLNEGYVSAGTVSGRNGNLDFDLSGLADGSYKLQVRVRDSQYATTLSAFNETESAVIDFSIDTLAPALSLDELVIQNRYGGADTTVTSNFNGTYVNNDFTMEFTATDASGIVSVETSLNNVDWTAAGSLGGGVYQAAIPISALNDGTRVLYYRATDNNAKVTSALVTLIVDKTEPTVNFNSPSGISTLFATNAPNVNGTAVTITGSISDGSSIASLSLVGGLSDNVPLSNTTGNNTNWAFTFNSTLYDEATFATDVGGNVWRLPIKVTAFDVAGNRVITTGYIDLDPDGDKPIVSISTPAANASVTGIVTLNGTVNDDDGTSGTVLIELDTNNDWGTIEESFPGVAVTNGAWNQQINTAGTLIGTVRFRVTPTDTNGKLGDPLDRTIFIDSSLPQIVGYDGSNELLAPTPATGTRQRGVITVRALFKDDDSIPEANLQVSLDGGTSYVAISTQPGYSRNQLADAGGKKRYDVQFDVNTATYFSNNSGTGSLSVILQITDNTYKPGVVALTYAADNRPPEGYWDPAATLTPPQAGRYSFSGSGLTNSNKLIGTAVDGGAVSGVSFVDVFFVKGGQLLDPKTGLGIGAPSAAVGDNLYTQMSFTAGAINAGTDIITLDRTGWGTVNNNLPVRFIGSSLPGGLNANTLYYVRDVVGNTFKVYTTPTGGTAVDLTSAGSGIFEYALSGVPYTSAAYPAGGTGPAYAIRIDKRTELGANDGNENGDGDGFQESLKDKGGFDEWFAYFNTTLLPNGPLTVYYVVNDENGNKVIGRIDGQIANNPPSVTSITVNGTAMNGTPWKVKASGSSIPVVIGASDSGSGQMITAAGWKLAVLAEYNPYGAGPNIGDVDTSTAVNTYTTWFYGSEGGAIRDFSARSSGVSATATVNIDVSGSGDGFAEGQWYLMQATAVDADENIAVQEFYMRVVNNDVTFPVATMDDITQAKLNLVSGGHIEEAYRFEIESTDVNDATDTISVTNTTLANDYPVMFRAGSGTLPAGLSANTTYYIVGRTGTTIQVSATKGGSAVNLTSAGSGTFSMFKVGWLSGSLTLTGTAWDDINVGTIKVQISNNNGTSWSDLGTATRGAVLSGNAVLGYTYAWSLDWDTVATNGGAYAIAGNNLALRTTVTDNTNLTENDTDHRVDVVPYISGITTVLSNAESLNPSVFARGSLGAYPVRSNEQITLSGYNFDGASTVVTLNGARQTVAAGGNPNKQLMVTLGNWAITATNGTDTFTTPAAHNLQANSKVRFSAGTMPTGLTANQIYYVRGATLTATTFQVSATAGGASVDFTTNGTSVVLIPSSGEVIAETAGVESRNNSNNNSLPQNKEANGVNNELLTDDRALVVWGLTSVTGTDDMRNLDFAINPSTDSLNFSAGSQDTYFSLFLNVAGSTVGTTNNARQAYTRYFDNRLAFNTQGTPFHVSQSADTLNIPVTAWTSPSHFAVGRGQPATIWEYNTSEDTGLLYIESNWNGAALNNLTRIQGSDLKIRGNDALSQIYLSYYDSTQKLIKFRYGEMGTAGFTAGLTTSANMGTITSTFQPYTSATGANGAYNANDTEQAVTIYTSGNTYHQGYVAIAGANANSNQSSVGFLSDGTAVVAWYDQVAGDLKIKYNSAPATSYSAYQSFNSQTDTVPAAGTYTFKLRVNGTLVNSGNDLTVTVVTPANEGATGRRHELAYQLNLLFSNNGYGAYAEVNPVTSRVTVRTMQTGAGTSIGIEAPTAGTSLLSAIGVQAAVPGIGNAWTEQTIDANAAGKNVQMVVDQNNGLHFSYQNTSFGDLRYAYLNTLGGTPVVLNVDTYGQVGQYSDINTYIEDINGDGDTEIVPYISYYSIAYADTTYSLRQARLMTDSINTVADGSSTALSGLHGATSDRYTGNWEIMAVPVIQAPKQYRVNSALTSVGDFYLGYQVDDTLNPIEYARRF